MIRFLPGETDVAYRFRINGKTRDVDVPGDMPLLWVLRNELGMVGTKFGCGVGMCGACTVHLDGEARRSCQTPVASVGKASITTIEGLGSTPIGARLQKAWLDKDVMQCGYCQAGQLMSASALLKTTPNPTHDEVEQAMAGNICRCACYTRIKVAILEAVAETGREKSHA
ncbi:MAG: (2Fe-2S)-binding protein [Sphingobium sp.]|nr:(2Fe-2S)-binding protein [Sphingobium sp.]